MLQDGMISEQFVEQTASWTPFEPDKFPGLIAWFKADDFAPNGEGTGISLWYGPGSESLATGSGFSGNDQYVPPMSPVYVVSASQGTAANMPKYTTVSMGGYPALFFDGNDRLLLNQKFSYAYTLNSAITGTIMILLQSVPGTSSTLLGNNDQQEKLLWDWNGGNPRLNVYMAGNRPSTPLSSSAGQPILAVFNFPYSSSAHNVFFEGKYWRGSSNASMGRFSYIGWCFDGTYATGSISEIVLYNQVLTPEQIEAMYDGYWMQKYWNAGLYHPDPITQSGLPYIPMAIGYGQYGIDPDNQVVVKGGQFVESPYMTKMIRVSNTYNWIKTRKFIETGSVLPPPPPHSGSATYDPLSASFIQYESGSTLVGKNSGSNEWSRVTPACAYVARETFIDFQAYDVIMTYTRPTYTWITSAYVSGTRPEDNPSRGYLYWSSSLYPYVSHNAFIGVKMYDSPRMAESNYPTNSLVISESNFTGGYSHGTGSGYGWNYGGYWSGSWQGRSNFWGIWGYENISASLYFTNSFVNGLMGSGSMNPQWNAFFSASWTGSTPYRWGIKAYESMTTTSYETGSEINGSSSYASDSRYLGFGSSSWIGRTL